MLPRVQTLFFALLLQAIASYPAFGEEDFPSSGEDSSQSTSATDDSASAIENPLVNDTIPLDTATSSGEKPEITRPQSDTADITTLAKEDTTGMAKAVTAKPIKFADTLGGNLPRIIEPRTGPYLVTSDIYVPSGKSVVIKPGTIILFKNFTELHVEGRLCAEGTSDHPIIFTSEFDQTYNPASTLRANPYDWNGVFIHENGLGSSFAHCTIQYTVYGINALTRYIKIDAVHFKDNGRADLTIEGKRHTVSTTPYSYSLTINDAKKDGVPVAILMDPKAKKRNALRYGGLSLTAFGITMGAWSLVLLDHDQAYLDSISTIVVNDENSPLVAKWKKEWPKARDVRNRDIWMASVSFLCAVIGSTGVVWSFRF